MILYRDLIEIFPNCKVILTVASDSSVWYELVKSSLHSPEELTKVQQNDGKHKSLNICGLKYEQMPRTMLPNIAHITQLFGLFVLMHNCTILHFVRNVANEGW